MDGPLPDSDDDTPVKLASLLVIGLGLTALFLGFEWFWIVFAVGFAVLVPAVKILTDEGEDEAAGTPDRTSADSRREPQSDRLGADAPESKQDALDALRHRYAAGELDEATFERKVERLLETETLEGARDHVARGSERADRPGSRPARDADESQRGRDADESQRDRATER